MNIYHSDIRDYIAENTKLLGLPLEGKCGCEIDVT